MDRQSPYVVPDKGAATPVIAAFMDKFFDHDSPGRREWISELYLSKLMMESIQWAEPERTSSPGRVPIRWTMQAGEDQDEIPKPVTNEILPIADNEIARLRNRRSKPRIRSQKKNDSASKVGAKSADDILEWHLEETVQWPSVRRTGIYNDVVYGTGILWSYLEQTWTQTVRVGKAGAYRCLNGSCGSILAEQDVPSEKVLGLPEEQVSRLTRSESWNETKAEMSVSYTAQQCLDCGAPLNKSTLTPEEGAGQDVFGRDLGMDVPLGIPMLEAPSPFEMFWENEGVGVDRKKCAFGRQVPRSLDELAARYNLTYRDGRYFKVDQSTGQEVELTPEQPELLCDQHPIIGEASYGMSGSSSSNSRNLYRHHARERAYYCPPSKRHPKGRAIIMAGNLVVMDDDYLVESKTEPGLMIPRVKCAVARYWEKTGMVQGQGIVVPLISPQKRINMTWSQVIATRERCSVAGILSPRGARISSPGWVRGIPGYVAYYETDELQPGQKPEPFPAQSVDRNIYEEQDRTVQRMQYIAGVQDVDVGKAPPNISAASAIKLLQDQASERRAQRQEEFTDAEKEVWSHQLLLLREFVREPRAFKYLSKSSGQWEDDMFVGSDLAGQTDLTVEEEPSFDDVAYERENVIQGLQMQIIAPATPFSRYALGKALGLPSDALEEQSVQVDDALRRWFAFRDRGVIPSIDEFEDDHNTFWNVYGKEFKAKDGLRFKEECGWDALLKVIAGWEQKLAEAEMLDIQMRKMTQAIKSGMQVPMAPGLEQQLATYQPLPKAMEDKVFYVWSQLATANQQQQAMSGMPVTAPAYKLDHPFVRFKAVAEAHRIYDQRKTAAAQMAPVAAAPGAAQTAQGTEPTAAQPQSASGVPVQ